jgi:hypothetical protein
LLRLTAVKVRVDIVYEYYNYNTIFILIFIDS